MSLISLYSQKKSAFGPPTVQDNYQDNILQNDANRTSDLVMKYEQAELFRPPAVTDTYLAKLFTEGVVPRNF